MQLQIQPTPQTDLDDVPAESVVLHPSGIIDMEGSSVHSSDQMNSAISSLQGTTNNFLQGTMIVPHGSTPLNEYNNPNLWLGSYPWLFPHGRGAPEIACKVKVGLTH